MTTTTIYQPHEGQLRTKLTSAVVGLVVGGALTVGAFVALDGSDSDRPAATRTAIPDAIATPDGVHAGIGSFTTADAAERRAEVPAGGDTFTSADAAERHAEAHAARQSGLDSCAHVPADPDAAVRC